MTFDLASPFTYRYFRMTVANVRTAGNGFQISEFNLLGDFNRDDFAADVRYTQNLYIAEMQNWPPQPYLRACFELGKRHADQRQRWRHHPDKAISE